MMYKCNKCGVCSSAIEWNARTKNKIGIIGYVNPIENNDYGTYFYCPNCNKESDRDDIEEILDDECDNEIVIITKDEDIKWLLEELLRSTRYADVDFQKISEIAKRNGYTIDDDLDLEEIGDDK